MAIRYSAERVPLLEPIHGQRLVIKRQVLYGHGQVVRDIEQRHQVGRLVQRNLL